MVALVPIELLGIQTECLPGAGVEISWQSAAEINTSHFEIYSSDDAMDWIQIGSVNASGNNTLGENSNDISFETVKLMKKLSYIDRIGKGLPNWKAPFLYSSIY